MILFGEKGLLESVDSKNKIVFAVVVIVNLFYVHPGFGQEVYFIENVYKDGVESLNRLMKMDVRSCEIEFVFDFAEGEDPTSVDQNASVSRMSPSFHPDGLLYVKKSGELIGLNVHTRKIEKRIEITQQKSILSTGALAISEEGEVWISEIYGSSPAGSAGYQYDRFSLRDEEVLETFTSVELFGEADIDLPIGGFLENGHPLFITNQVVDGSPGSNYFWSTNHIYFWNIENSELDSLNIDHSKSYIFYVPSIYRPGGEPLQILTFGGYDRFNYIEMLHGHFGDHVIDELCPRLLFDGSWLSTYHLIFMMANVTDFRQSSLRIHLDHDQSSGHMTGGYYDTLTACKKEVPIADEDIELFTSGGVVDSVSFRLRYFDRPNLKEEYLTAEEEEHDFRRTSLSRWVWENPYESDEAKIKDFLRSVRYHADWDRGNPEQMRERVVMTTMYVDGDSTTSWSVYQLEDRLYAGEDTLVTYCPGTVSLDLSDYLSADATPGGRFEPELRAGGTIFTPGGDLDSIYLYIVEEGGCADTAEIEVGMFSPEMMGFDTVFLCPGQEVKIGVPPNQYEVEWWDGTDGDSILVSESDLGSKWIKIQGDGCGIQGNIEIVSQDLTGRAGEDREIFYCEGETKISLFDSMPMFPGMERRIEGLRGRDGIFRPDEDEPGDYQYILSVGNCADTAMITMTPVRDQEIFPGEIILCYPEARMIGFEPGDFDEVIWEDGRRGDSVEVDADHQGLFSFEANRSGCRYYGAFEILVQTEISFPDMYMDTVKICPDMGEKSLPVMELDSVRWEGHTYFEGDEMVFYSAGDFQLTGYLDGCAAETVITVEEISGFSDEFSDEFYFCKDESMVLTLPEDTDEYVFSWIDGTAGRKRTEQNAGEYYFRIQAEYCEFEGSFSLVLSEDEDCVPPVSSSCHVSIPNAVSPNGDGVNDHLDVFFSPDCGSLVILRLFDKWGELIYSTKNPRIDEEIWDDLPSGMYLVQVDYEDEKGGVKREAQSVMVIR